MAKKIQGVEVAPSANQLHDLIKSMELNQYVEFIEKVDASKHGFDSKGNYLHWDSFVPRAKDFNRDEKALAYLVLKKQRNLKPHGGLVDEHGVPFLFTDQGLAAKLHQISQLETFEHLKVGEIDKRIHLVNGVIMEEAISSAQLEGAATTRTVAKKMLETGREAENDSEKMIVNNWNLIREAEHHKNDPLSIDLILFFNKTATIHLNENGHVAGNLRDDVVSVSNTMTGELVHEPPMHTQVEAMLQMLCDYANSEHTTGGNFIHPIIKACVLHFMIGYIHPFFDGNGRTARALFYWYMLKSGYENFKYISISALLKNAPTQYMKSYLYTETDENDLTHFVDYQLTIIIKALNRFTDYIHTKVSELENAMNILRTSPLYSELSLPHITILEKALKNPGRIFIVKEVESDLSVSSTTARGYLDKLADMKLLMKTHLSGRTYGYMSPADLKERLSM